MERHSVRLHDSGEGLDEYSWTCFGTAGPGPLIEVRAGAFFLPAIRGRDKLRVCVTTSLHEYGVFAGAVGWVRDDRVGRGQPFGAESAGSAIAGEGT